MKKQKLLLIVAMLIVLMFLAGCSTFQSTNEKIYNKLEKVVTLEKDFKEQQEPLVTLEKNEQKIYSQIVSLDLESMDGINELADEALASLKKRKELMKKEEASIKKSEETFKTVQTNIEDIKDEELKEKADELYQTMMARYDAHEKLYSNYLKGLKNDEKLYKLFKAENLNIDDLEKQIQTINDIYKEVLDNNKEFNELTEKYNKEKIHFYKQAGMEVEEEQSTLNNK
ncbi:YkyA family protein [Niallia nealsonii]|uniref:Cell-wall binding lipoprotein n=1 Tax=Niallia nealsonii TaxID=115979 RepID=A0A2N0YY53_9BACI|nr:YkyA family protein [Niallia nealsonii]PKG22175.1 hypothetical protein CWS01_18710 [Niallia nealsonii]